MPGSPKKRAAREAAGLPVAPRSTLMFNVAVLRKMRKEGMPVDELRRFGMTDANFNEVMGYNDGTSNPDMYLPTLEECTAVEEWVIAGYGHPLKLKDMLLELFDLDLSVDVIKRAFRTELSLGKEKMVVRATRNVISSIKEGDVGTSFKYLEARGGWKAKDAPPAGGGNTTNIQVNITSENAAATYQKLIKGN